MTTQTEPLTTDSTANLGFMLQQARRRVDKPCLNPSCNQMMHQVTVAKKYCSNRCLMQVYRATKRAETSADAEAAT